MVLNDEKNGLHTGMMLIDFWKAFNTFDSFDYQIILHLMKCLDFFDKTIKWFYCYLTLKALFVSLYNVFQKHEPYCGVSQNPIKEIMWFLLYINVTPQAQSNSHAYWYAGDTTICHLHENVSEIENVLNNKFAKTCNWFVDNKLFVDHFG